MASLEKTVFVSNAAQLKVALSAATGGEKIILAGGDYGDLRLAKKQYASDVTVVSADADQPATFGSIYLHTVKNVTFDKVFVDFVPDKETVSFEAAVTIKYSEGIRVVDSMLEGGPAVNGVPPETPPGGLDKTGNVLGYPAARAFTLNNSKDIAIENSDISQFGNGINSAIVDGLTVVGNNIHHLRMTPLRGGVNNNVIVEDNHFHDFTPWRLGGAGDHGDMIHFWTDPKRQDSASVDFLIRNNFFDQGEGASLLGIYLDDNGNHLGFENVVIENNILHNDDAQGIRLENVDGGTVRHNTLLGTTDNAKTAPAIILKDESRNLIIEDNILKAIFPETRPGHRFEISPENLATIVMGNNLFVQRHDPQADNYYADLFVNALTAPASIGDLQAFPGGLIEALGVGALKTLFDATPDDLTALMLPHQYVLQKNLFRFNGELTADEDGFVDAADATFQWDFGDGATATGIDVDHVFSQPGSYTVVLKVIHKDGSVDTAKSIVHASDPQLLDLRFGKDGPIDVSAYRSVTVMTDKVEGFGKDIDADAYRLNESSSFAVAKSADQLHSLSYMTVSFAIKRDSALSGDGEIMRMHGDWNIALTKKGEIHVFLENADGDILRMASKGAGLDDVDWHAVSLVYDSVLRKADIYVDNEVVASAPFHGMTPQQTSGGFMVGNIFGKNFLGQIQGVEIRGDRPSADAPPIRHQQLADGVTFPFLDLDGKDSENLITKESVYFSDWRLAADESDQPGAVETGTSIDGHDNLLAADNKLELPKAGGDGDDVHHVDDEGDRVWETGDGQDVVVSSADFNLPLTVEDLELTGAADLTGRGASQANMLIGNYGKNTLLAGGDHDLVLGGGGGDIVVGHGGADDLQGENGDDRIDGGAGADRLLGGYGDNALIGDAGRDHFEGGHGDDEYFIDQSNETIVEIGTGYDRAFATTDFYLPELSEEVWLLGTGDDIARGNEQANVLVGNDGDNTLSRMDGNDRMAGGAGADIFEHTVGDGADITYSFENGIDRSDLTDHGFADFVQPSFNIVNPLGGAAIDLGGGDAIRLAGLDASLLEASDFIL